MLIFPSEFPIQLDTGSSDLWIKPPFNVTFSNQTNIQTNLTFGIGQASGNVAFADVSLGPYKVKNQGTYYSMYSFPAVPKLIAFHSPP